MATKVFAEGIGETKQEMSKKFVECKEHIKKFSEHEEKTHSKLHELKQAVKKLEITSGMYFT